MAAHPIASEDGRSRFYGGLVTPEAWAKRFEGLEPLERLEMDTIARLAGAISGGAKLNVLDAGCGTARMRALYPEATYVGLDMSPQFVRYCQRQCGGPKTSFLLADVNCLPFHPGVFDVVLVIGTLESEHDPGALLVDMVRCVRPGGRLVFTLQNRRNIPGRLANVFGRAYRQTFWSRRALAGMLTSLNLPFAISTCYLLPPGVFRALFRHLIRWRWAQRLLLGFYLIVERANISLGLQLGYQWVVAVGRPSGGTELEEGYFDIMFDFLLDKTSLLVPFLLEKPYLVVPVVVLEELGVPFPLLLSGLFIYVGYLFAQGDYSGLVFIPANLVGGFIGATGVYWLARVGASLSLWRNNAIGRLVARSRRAMAPTPGLGLLAVVGARFSFLPMILVSAAFGAVSFPYWTYVTGALISVMMWNGVFVLGGVVAGTVASRFLQDTGPVLRYVPAVAIWLTIVIAFAWRRQRRRAKDRLEGSAARGQ